MTSPRSRACALLALLLALAASAPAFAQGAWPARPIRFVIGFAPGGSADVLARWLAEPLSRALGQQVVVDNRPGGGGNLGMELVAGAPPDGYTVGMGSVGALVTNQVLMGGKLPYNPETDLTPITQLASYPNVVVVHPALPARTMTELIEWLRAHPGEGYAIPGVGSSPHLVGEMLNRRFELKLQQVPYRSGGPALSDLLAGQVRVMVDNITTVFPPYQDGRLRALGLAARERSPAMPDVPTLNESLGADDLDLTSWQGLFGPRGLPDAIVQRLAQEFAAALALPELRERMLRVGATPVSSAPADFAAFVARERPRWIKLATDSGARLD
jgi:tripartite-type tricarboxylate transporter receptor subunit TctC